MTEEYFKLTSITDDMEWCNTILQQGDVQKRLIMDLDIIKSDSKDANVSVEDKDVKRKICLSTTVDGAPPKKKMLNSNIVDLSVSSDEEEEEEGINSGFHSSSAMLDLMLMQQNLEQYNNTIHFRCNANTTGVDGKKTKQTAINDFFQCNPGNHKTKNPTVDINKHKTKDRMRNINNLISRFDDSETPYSLIYTEPKKKVFQLRRITGSILIAADLNCPYCGKKYDTLLGLNGHLAINHVEEYLCQTENLW